ncbi:hypothetical protein TEK04_02385 [Klenkia sp. LSe6-5]|uniref:Uncharacterized protein n=1 Tax=Klenkia sesuvii TaxID=3103137 RepID=A0ABU8DR88_9ACTN
MTTLPIWAVYAVSLGAPVLALLGALIGHVLGRRASNELDIWRRREETMRMLRWASEQATSSQDAQARMGLAVLDALSDSELLQPPDQALVDAVLDTVLEEPVEEIETAESDVEVVEVDSDPGD